MSAYLSLIVRRRGGRLFEAGRLLTFSAFGIGACSRWALIRGWALIRINTVNVSGVLFLTSPKQKGKKVWGGDLTENLGNSGWKVNRKATFRKFQPKIEEYVLRYSSPFIPVDTVPSRFQTHATQTRPFFGFKL